MATTKENVNVYRKLANVREKFLATGVRKSGKNMMLKAKYFELDDIVPIAMPLFHEEGLIPLITFQESTVVMTVVDMDKPEEKVIFMSPLKDWNGNAGVTPIQALGANITYMRRYMYMIALDIVEDDLLDKDKPLPEKTHIENTVPEKKEETKETKIPVTAEQRETAKINLTNPDADVNTVQMASLKSKLKVLREKDPAADEYVASIAYETKGFKTLTRSRWEEIMVEVAEKIGG